MKTAFFSFVVTIALVACSEPPPDEAFTVPFDFHKNQILLETNVNGYGPYTFLLDSGVDPSVVDLGTVEEAGLPVNLEDAEDADGVGSEKVAIYGAELLGIEIGGRDFGNAEAAAMDLGPLEARLGRPFKGVLGFSFFQGKIVEINYSAQTVTFLPASWAGDCRQDEAETCFSIPLEPASDEDNIPKLLGLSASGVPLLVSMDTGSSGGFDINAETLDAFGIAYEIYEDQEVTVTGARGSEVRTSGVIKDVALGPFMIGDVEARFVTGHFDPDDYRYGNVGNVLFKAFVVTLDYVHGRIVFRK